MLGTTLRLQVSPHRLAVVLLVREYCHYKMSVPVTPRDRSAACLLILSLVQSPDLDLATSCKKYALDLQSFMLIYSFCFICIFVPRISEKVRLPGLVVAWARGVCRLQVRA